MSCTNAIRLLFAVLAIGFFATPVAARVLGVTAESFENRRFAERPNLSQGWDAFQQTGRFLVDRMPLRAHAVRANTRIWTDIFGTTPRYGTQHAIVGDQGALPFEGDEPTADRQSAAQRAAVLTGRDGWLFLIDELRRSCTPPIPVDTALLRWRKLVAEIRSRGKRAMLVVAPDKSTIYPEHLQDGPDIDCAADAKRRVWRTLGDPSRRASVAPLRGVLLERKRASGDDLYARKDSHWTSLGSLALVTAVLGRVGSGIVIRDDEITDPGPSEYTGDLSVLLGTPEVDTRAQRGITRRPGAKQVPGRTVIVGDSFFDAAQPQLTPYLEQSVVLSWVNTPLAEIAAEIRRADTVVLETVERELTFRAADDAYVPPLLDMLSVGRARP